MFNFDNATNVTNKKNLQLADVRVYSNNKVRFSDEARKKLNTNGRNVVILKLQDGTLVVASTASDSGSGRALNSKGEYTHQIISSLLGGKHSEWEITGEGQKHPITEEVYYELSQTVNGSDVATELSEIANEAPEVIETDNDVIASNQEISENTEELSDAADFEDTTH